MFQKHCLEENYFMLKQKVGKFGEFFLNGLW